MQTDLGEKVLVLGDAAKGIAKQEGFVSGARVSLEGVFISRGAGAVRPVSGAAVAKAQYCFVGNDIAKTAPSAAEARAAAAGPPTVTRERAAGVAAGGCGLRKLRNRDLVPVC